MATKLCRPCDLLISGQLTNGKQYKCPFAIPRASNLGRVLT